MKRKIFIIFVLIVLVFSFSAVKADCSNDILKIKLLKRPFNLNPIYASNETELLVVNHLFDSLVSYNSDGKIVSELAKSWQVNKNGDRFLFNLKEKVFFNKYSIKDTEISSKKRRVTAADWKWSLEYLADLDNNSPYAYLLAKVKGYNDYRQKKAAEIKGIKVLNDYKLEIELKESYAPFIHNLAHHALSVIPRRAVLERENFALKPVGTGSFFLSDFLDDKLILKKNSDSWLNNYQQEKIPFLNEIELNFSAENLAYDNFDIYKLNKGDYLKYKDKPFANDYKLKKIADNTLFYLAFNYKNKSTKALIEDDKKKLSNYLKALLAEKGFLTKVENQNLFDINSLSLSNSLLNNFNLKKQNLNLNPEEKISRLETNSLNLMTYDSELQNELSSLLKDFAENKLILNFKTYNWVEYLAKLNSDNKSDIFLMTYSFNNKFEFLYDNFYSKSDLNYFNYKNERIDNLLDYLILFNDQKNKKRAYKLIEAILKKENPYLFVLQGADSYLINSNLKNIDKLNNLYLKEKLNYLSF